MKHNPNKNPMKCQDIHLINKTRVTVAWKLKVKCPVCKRDLWAAVRHSDMKLIYIEVVGLCEWDEHRCAEKTLIKF